MPKGTIGFRWAQEDPGKWNLEMQDGVTGEPLYPALSFLEDYEEIVELEFDNFSADGVLKRSLPSVVRSKRSSSSTAPRKSLQ